MIDDSKIIGVCLTKCEDDFRTDYLSALHKRAAELGYKIIVFNSLRDLYYSDEHDKGSASVFDIINYNVIDALVVLGETIYDHIVKERLISTARSKNVPVVLVHEEHEGCFCIVSDYTEAYTSVIDHLIKVHGVKSPCFIGGRCDVTSDPDTVLRLECVKKAFTDNGLTFPDDRVYYGDYWDVPAMQIVQDKILKLPELPDAVICANDTMAMAVCEELRAHGIKVPDDVIVTGFDGLISAEYFIPRLTTCREDVDGLASITMELVNNSISGKIGPGVYFDRYVPYFGESCGCKNDTSINYRERALTMYKLAQEMQNHEGHIYAWVDSILESDNIKSLSAALKDYILPNSDVCLSESFMLTALGQNSGEKLKSQPGKELFVISSMSVDYSVGKQHKFPTTDMVPDLHSWLEDDTICIITPIFVGSEVCGYYAVKTKAINDTARKLFRVSKTMNIAFGSLLNKLLKRSMQTSMQNAVFLDSLTGLPNLKGLSKWFDEFQASPQNHEKTIMVSIYAIPQYKFIYENYGMDDIDEAVKFVADALVFANKDNGYIARTADDEFIIVNYVDDENEVGELINESVRLFFGVIEGFNNNSSKDYFLEVNCGCTVANAGWSGTLRSFMKLANAEMYMNRLKAGLTPVMKEEKLPFSGEKNPKDRYSEFSTLIEKNLFTYYFQPIVDARTGEIYAYEALMRSSGGIKMSPLEILDIAKEYNMLYDIEKATMFNVMERYRREKDTFGSAKVFINTIPGNFLKQDDLDRLKELYGQYVSNFVIEITEQDTVSDDELDSIRHLGIVGNTEEYADIEGGQIAVDDYGTGHSNIVNLLRYAPHIIKIDRFLITNIQNDPNKQMFVKSTIEFAKMNNIKVLAEGVETYEEMRTVIEYGVDLIQGYYTARPAEQILKEIPENIRSQIIDENISLARYDSELLTYRSHKEESINLYELTLQKFGRLQIPGGNVTLTGNSDFAVDFNISTSDGSVSEITLDGVCLKSAECPAIQLGSGSSTIINLKGNNSIHKNAILVPEDASVRFVGDGNLNIFIKKSNGVGIGCSWDSTYGDITFEQTGTIAIDATIDKCVCIGGGSPGKGSEITFAGGTVSVTSKCVDSVGVGSVNGRAKISITDGALLSSRCSGRRSVAMGSFDGETEIFVTGELDLLSDGERVCAMGTLGRGHSEIKISGGATVSSVVHGDNAACIGSIGGKTEIDIEGGRVNTYGEGDSVCGVGSSENEGVTHIGGGTVSVKILSGNILQFGSDDCTTVITGGNIVVANPELIHPVNDFGEPLHPERPETYIFTRTIHSLHGEYKYTAERQFQSDDFCIYLP